MKKLLIVSVCFICFSAYSITSDLKVGQALPKWKSLLEHNDISLINKCKGKVLIINYIDPRYDEQSIPAVLAVRNAIVDGRLSLKNFQTVGIVDCDTTWKPNSLIRSFAIRANKKLPHLKSILLFDYKGILGNKYGLISGKENRNAIVLVDKQKICRAVYRDKMSKKQIADLVNMAVSLQHEPYKQARQTHPTK